MGLALLFVLACACRQAGLEGRPGGPVEVRPERLDFGNVFLGASASRTLVLRNPATVARTAAVAVAPPFSVGVSEIEVIGGDEVELSIRFTPETLGEVATTVEVDSSRVELRGVGQAPRVCAAPSACHSSVFNTQDGRCVTEARPEGAACATRCLSNGACLGGVCRGAFTSCDDNNPCTLESCDEARGCQRSPVICAPPRDPCLAAVCDRQLGCITRPVDDGIRCGPENCATNRALVCISGTCVSRARPQGELCFEVLAGTPGGLGRVDGRGSEARFMEITAATTDRQGNTWVFGDGTVRLVTAGGVVTTLVRSDGSRSPRDGVGVAGIGTVRLAAADASGAAYFVDFSSGVCVRKVTSWGEVRTVAGDCTQRPPTGPPAPGLTGNVAGLAVLTDGMLYVVDGEHLRRLQPDGGFALVAATERAAGPLGESAEGQLLVPFLDAQGVPVVFAISPNGERREVRRLGHGAPHQGVAPFRVWSIGPDGTALASYETDAGCLLSTSGLDGSVAELGYEAPFSASTAQAPCFYAIESRTWAGSPLYRAWLGGDGVARVARQGISVGVERGGDGGREVVAGVLEHWGESDGYGADAGLFVAAGFGGAGHFDPMVVRHDGRLLVADPRSQRLRHFADDGGLTTLDLPQSHIASLQLTDGGVWVVGYAGRSLLRGDSFAEFLSAGSGLAGSGLTYNSQSFVESDGSHWMFYWFVSGLLIRTDPALNLVGIIRDPNREIRDGPLPDINLDGGWTETGPGMAGFKRLRAPIAYGGGIAFIDADTVRLMRNGALVTLAGGPSPGFVDGFGPSARFDSPLGLALSPSGDILVADSNNNAIRLLSPQGQVRTVGRLTDRPAAVAVSANGDVYVLVRHALLRGR